MREQRPVALPARERMEIRRLYREGMRMGQLAALFRRWRGTIAWAVADLPKHKGGFKPLSEEGRRARLERHARYKAAKRAAMRQGLDLPSFRIVRPRVERWRYRYFPPAHERGIREWRCYAEGCGRLNTTNRCECGQVPSWAA